MLVGVGGLEVDSDSVVDVLARPDDELGDLVELAASVCRAPAAGITVYAGDQLVVPVTHGIRPFTSPVSATFCHVARDLDLADGTVCVEDASRDVRFVHLTVGDGPMSRTRFYASAPLTTPDGTEVGRLCVIDDAPRTLDDVQRRVLGALATSASRWLAWELTRRRAEGDQAAPPPPGRVPGPRSGEDPAGVGTAETAGASEVTEVSEGDQKRASEVVSQMAAELSHDLRVPLTSVIASVEMLEEELGDHAERAVAALLGKAIRAADRMIKMLDQNLEGGGDPTRRTRVDLGTVVEQLVMDSAPLLEPVGAIVEHRGLPVVLADPDDMYSVLQNLVTNSVKFARPDVPAWVKVSARRSGDRWRISVRDNGVGIAEDRRVDVFSLFDRTGGDVEGHGIGLATVARIVKAHGGRAGVEPVAGSGTEVWFELPGA